TVKVSAAWLIEKAGFGKGYGHGNGVAISGKHTLALTNRGGGTADALLALAREIRDGVHERFAVTLRPEPVLVNCQLLPARRVNCPCGPALRFAGGSPAPLGAALPADGAQPLGAVGPGHAAHRFARGAQRLISVRVVPPQHLAARQGPVRRGLRLVQGAARFE